jgi:hypothetical protein
MSSNGLMRVEAGEYDEALIRLHRTGPEFDGYLSNHAPMVVEILARRGHADQIHRWTDEYMRRLDDLPRGGQAVTSENWRAALGRVDLVSDWIDYLLAELADDPWREVLARWWPRLLPGIAAGATHGVIRTGHAVRGLAEVESAPRLAELGHALAYWAARWQPIPTVLPGGTRSPAALLASIPRVARQQDGIRERLAQLESTAGWSETAAMLTLPTDDNELLAAIAGIVDAAVVSYPGFARPNPTMLVHAVTAPNAVAMALMQLPQTLWRDSVNAAWTASAAVFAAYASLAPTEPISARSTPIDSLDEALQHGGEHVIKLADAALTSYDRVGNRRALSAIATAVRLDA